MSAHVTRAQLRAIGEAVVEADGLAKLNDEPHKTVDYVAVRNDDDYNVIADLVSTRDHVGGAIVHKRIVTIGKNGRVYDETDVDVAGKVNA